MATHSSTLAWRFPWTEEPGGLQSMGSPRVRHNWVTKFNFLDDRKGQVLQGPGKKGFSAARTGRAKCLRLSCAGGVVRWPALRMPAGQVECDLVRRARQGPGLIALGSHHEMGRLQTQIDQARKRETSVMCLMDKLTMKRPCVKRRGCHRGEATWAQTHRRTPFWISYTLGKHFHTGWPYQI